MELHHRLPAPEHLLGEGQDLVPEHVVHGHESSDLCRGPCPHPGRGPGDLHGDAGLPHPGLGSAQQDGDALVAVRHQVDAAADARGDLTVPAAGQIDACHVPRPRSEAVVNGVDTFEQLGQAEGTVLEPDHPDERNVRPGWASHASRPAWTLTCS